MPPMQSRASLKVSNRRLLLRLRWPHEALEPMAPADMFRACARVMPTGRVAHLGRLSI